MPKLPVPAPAPAPQTVHHGRPVNDYPRIIAIVVVLGLVLIASLWILQPFLPALIWSTMIVVATWPMLLRLQRWVGGSRGIATAIMTAGIVLALAVPLLLAVGQLVRHADDIANGVRYVATHSVPPPPAWVERIPLAGATLSERWQALADSDPKTLLSPLAPYAGNIASWAAARAGNVGALTIHLLLIVVLCAVLYVTGEQGARGVRRLAHRMADEHGTHTLALATQAIRAVAMGIVVTAIAQSVMAGVGLAIAGVPYATLFTVLMFVLCVAQIGAVPVLLPAAIWLFWRGDTGWGTFLVIWIVVVSAMDNILRPMLIRRGADLPLLLIMAGVIGGLLTLGGVGLFVGPVVLAVMYTLTKAWVEQDDEPVTTNAAAARTAAHKKD